MVASMRNVLISIGYREGDRGCCFCPAVSVRVGHDKSKIITGTNPEKNYCSTTGGLGQRHREEDRGCCFCPAVSARDFLQVPVTVELLE